MLNVKALHFLLNTFLTSNEYIILPSQITYTASLPSNFNQNMKILHVSINPSISVCFTLLFQESHYSFHQPISFSKTSFNVKLPFNRKRLPKKSLSYHQLLLPLSRNTSQK
ncbi:hypothetical protein Droror1_Dr00017312 [Drosera rotundifolia]